MTPPIWLIWKMTSRRRIKVDPTCRTVVISKRPREDVLTSERSNDGGVAGS